MKVWVMHEGEIKKVEVIDYTYDLKGFCYPTGFRTEDGVIILIIEGVGNDQQTNNICSDSFDEFSDTLIYRCA